MLKKILGILAVLAVLTYLVFAVLRFSGEPSARKCSGVVVQVMDSSECNYVTKSEIRDLMLLNGLKLVGQRLDEIRYGRVEYVVSNLRMVRRVECYSTNAGLVCVKVWQHSPVLRVMQGEGSYYVDTTGRKLDISYNSAADVPVASGNIHDSVQVKRLWRMAMLLRRDPFWNAQVQQIYVEPNGEWTLIPRVGDQEIHLGLPNGVEEKLDRLRLFYLKALPKAGWNTYSEISVKYRNQIICTKKEE